MIKALTQPGPDGARILVLGLSHENWRRLSAGDPIPVRLRDLDPALPDVTVLIIGGPTEEQLHAQLVDAGARIDRVHYGKEPRP